MINQIEDLKLEDLYLEEIREELSHLNANDILSIIRDYRSELTVKEIINKYRIKVIPSKFRTILPLIKVGKCEFCNQKISYEIESKSNLYSFLRKETAICDHCLHKPNVNRCDCSQCKSLELEKQRLVILKQQQDDAEKIKTIQRNYNFENYAQVAENQLNLAEKLALSAVVRTCLSEDGTYIKPLKSSIELLTPLEDFTTQLIRSLTMNEILVPSVNSHLSAFVFNENNECKAYYTYEVQYLLNIEANDKYSLLIERLIYPEINVSEFFDDFVVLWKKLALNEVLSYFLNQMSDVGYNFIVGEITVKTFEKLLENFSVGQIYNLIFRAIANSTKAYQSGDYTKKHAMNMVVASCRNQGERAFAEKWDLKAYSRIKKLPESELSRLLFTVILKKPNSGFYNSPTTENLIKLIND